MKSEEIAKEIGCSGRTVRRELAKGKTELQNSDLSTRIEYSADIGQQKHDYAGTAKGTMLKIGKDYEMVEYIEKLIIKEKMSPYSAAQKIKQEGKFKTSISYKTIYNYIDAGLFPNLTNKHLPVKRNSKKRKHGNKEFREKFKTITCDNGCENLDYEGIERSVLTKGNRTRAYYAHPYSAWERGLNENANKLIRRFIPKGADIAKFSHERINMIEHRINNYPR